MNLRNKKKLIAKVLGVGTDKIILTMPEDIKDAITRQDIRELFASKVIILREDKGKRKVEKSDRRKGRGNVKKTIRKRKKHYMILVRKLRKHAKALRDRKKIDADKYRDLRKKIKSKTFKSLGYMQEHLRGVGK